MTDGRLSLEELKALSDTASTPEDFAVLERQLQAFELADTETARQKATLEQLQQQAAAWLIGVSTKHLRDQGVARNRDSTYNGPDLVQWIIDRKVTEARKEWERNSDVENTAKERQALARAEKLEEEAKALKDTHIERAQVTQAFKEMAAAVRSELELLRKLMANDFPEEYRVELSQELANHTKQVLRRLAARGQQVESAE